MSWNYGDILDAVGAVVPPEKPCLIHDAMDDTQVVSWGDFNRRTNNLARRFLNRHAQASDKVAFYLRNHPAYMEGVGACFKARLTHVNVNYRYVADELWYILDNSDSKIVIYASEFADQVRGLRERLPKVELWLEVCDGTPEVEFAVSFDELAEIGDGSPLDIPRSGDDMIFLYTGGTTGMPKGVMWAHDDHWLAGAAGATPATNMIAPKNIAEHAANVKAAGGGGVLLPCCPLMHGTGLFTAIGSLAAGGAVRDDGRCELRCERCVDERRTAQGDGARDRGRCVRETAVARTRRRTGPLRHQFGVEHHLERRDVEPRSEEGLAAPQSEDGVDRLVRCFRSDGLRSIRHHRGRHHRSGEVHARSLLQSVHGRSARSEAGQRRSRVSSHAAARFRAATTKIRRRPRRPSR